MRLVVDTNIVFSAVLHSDSRIARVLIAGKRHFEFHSCLFLHEEMHKHRSKLCALTGLSGKDMEEVVERVTHNIKFRDESTLSAWLIRDTEALLAKTDVKDVPFVALTRKLRARLWTGDKVLTRGLAATHPNMVIGTGEVWTLFTELES